MRLYLIRHGQSSNNALYSTNADEFETLRSPDPQLTDIGHQQAAILADYLSKSPDMPSPNPEPFNLTHLYVSPMLRAMDTAKPIAEALGIAPAIWTEIHEVGGLFLANGDGTSKGFKGITRQYIRDCYPSYTNIDVIGEDGWWTGGKESPGQFLSRAVKVALALKDRAATQDRIALVAHAAFLDGLIKALLNQIPLHPNTLFYGHYNTGITRFDIGIDSYHGYIDAMRLHYLNRVEHLSPEMRTW